MKKITLQEWAKSKFSPAPCPETLRRWARDGKISPAPTKVGRSYYVTPDAEYQQHAPAPAASQGRLLNRLRSYYGAAAKP